MQDCLSASHWLLQALLVLFAPLRAFHPSSAPCAAAAAAPQELKLMPGSLSAAAFASLVDAAAAVGSTAVHLTAVLEAAHQNVAGTEHHPLPLHLEVRYCVHAVHADGGTDGLRCKGQRLTGSTPLCMHGCAANLVLP